MTVLTTLRKNHQIYVEWSIEQFFDLPKDVDYFVESDPFSIFDGKWCLRIYPNGRKDVDIADNIDLNIKRLDSGEKITVEFETGFKRRDGLRFEASKFVPKSEDNTALYEWYNFGSSEYISKFKHSLGKDGAVTVFCIARFGDSIEVPPKTAPVDGKEILTENFRSMFYNQRFTDVTVVGKGGNVQLHKSVLSSRSNVLSSMFSSNEHMNHIELCDCDPDAFPIFLMFLYTGDSNIPYYGAMSLYNAAIKYDVADLKEACIRSMAEQPLQTYTFCEFYLSATIQGDSEKKDAAIQFFLHNAKEIISSSTWDAFAVHHPLTCKELLHTFVGKEEINKTDGKQLMNNN